MTPLRIGSLCSGYGGLDMAVQAVLPGAEVAWHAQWDPQDRRQHAARILAHRYPGAPNHGDITAADWFDAEPVQIITAGFPCQPISLAGQRKGTADARWIWPAVAQCVRLVRPRLVLLENVAALAVRGLANVAADLARIGYVGSWICLRASDVGAPHRRNRIFILAQPADADPADLRRPGRRSARGRRPGPAHHDLPAADTERDERPQDDPQRPTAAGRGRRPVPDTPSLGRHQRRTEPARQPRGPGVVGGGRVAADADGPALRPNRDGEPARQEADHGRHRMDPSGRFLGWGSYGPAVARWEHLLGRPAPSPVDARGRLAPPFVEWMMGLPSGWVTDVPGIPRAAQLKALGNGVVPAQGAAAFRILHQRLVGRMPGSAA